MSLIQIPIFEARAVVARVELDTDKLPDHVVKWLIQFGAQQKTASDMSAENDLDKKVAHCRELIAQWYKGEVSKSRVGRSELDKEIDLILTGLLVSKMGLKKTEAAKYVSEDCEDAAESIAAAVEGLDTEGLLDRVVTKAKAIVDMRRTDLIVDLEV